MKRTTALLSVGAIAVSLFAGVAFSTSASAAVAQSEEVETEQPSAEHRDGPRKHVRKGFVGAAAELLGMETDELREALSDGTTLAKVAADQGVSEDALVAGLLASVEEHVATALENDKITQEKADEILADAEDKINELINKSHEPRERGDRQERRAEAREALLEFLDLSREEVKEAFQAGSTLGDIAADQGISIDELTAFMTDYATAEINEAVADGKITQERADKFLENLPDRIEKRISHVPGSGRPEAGSEG